MCDDGNPQAARLSRHLKVARWLRRGGYIFFLLFVVWILIYTTWGAGLLQADSHQEAAESLSFGRNVSTVILRIAFGLLGLGILIPVVERVRYSKMKSFDENR